MNNSPTRNGFIFLRCAQPTIGISNYIRCSLNTDDRQLFYASYRIMQPEIGPQGKLDLDQKGKAGIEANSQRKSLFLLCLHLGSPMFSTKTSWNL